jgi:hypothetical protein
MVFEDSPTIKGSNNRDFTLLGTRDKLIDGQLSRICGEDYQLVQTEVLCYRFKHQHNVDIPDGTA